MDIIELILDEENEEMTGIEAVSIVENPAIESDFIALANQEIKFAKVDDEKKLLMGAALIPNKPIFRKRNDTTFYVYFSKDTVRRASELFFMNGNQNNATLEHDMQINNLTVVESWIVEDSKLDKSVKYGMNMPEGTWMISMKVENDEVWNDYIKTGKVKGFSIEGYFADKAQIKKPDLQTEMRKIEEEEAEYMLNSIRALIRKDKRTKAGKKIELETFNDYPDAVSNNAKRGIELNEKVNNKCATQVGKIRAQQLAQKENISVATLKRMYSYLSRAQEYYDESDNEACGTISYLLWGGKAGLRWSESKLKELGEIKAAEVGERGGIKKSPKAPKSGTPNKNPKGEGTAKGDASTSRGAKVSKQDEETLQKKSDEFNERYKDKLGYGVTIGQLKTVFQRGLGAFNTSHSPRVSSPKQWALARVNAYLYLVKNGRPQNPKYVGDFDLLPSKHPKSPKNK